MTGDPICMAAGSDHVYEEIATTQRVAMRKELTMWREAVTEKQIRSWSRDEENQMTIAILGAGAGLCTYSAVRAGFRPIWAAEIDETRNKILKDLYGVRCVGDAFEADYSRLERPRYLTTSMPCTNYSRSGDKTGRYGETGWMFVEQVKLIQ